MLRASVMNVMVRVTGRGRLAVGLGIVWVAIATGCQSLTYQPAVVIGLSPAQIPLTLEVRDLEDSSPEGDRSKTFGGTSATAADTMVGTLSNVLTEALIDNLSNDEVFREVRRKPEAPDLILSGKVRRFYGKSRLNLLGYISSVYTPVWFLGIPIYSSYGAVDLELRFTRPSGDTVATYAATASFDEWSSIYNQPLLGIGTRLNRALSDVVRDLRVQIVRDEARLTGAREVLIEPASDAGVETPAESDSEVAPRE